MGIIILPVFLAACAAVVLAVIKVIQILQAKQLRWTDLVFGLLLSGALFGLTILSFILEHKIYALSPFMRFPTVMFIVPMAIAMYWKNGTSKFRGILLMTVIFSGIVCSIFWPYVFETAEVLGLETYH